MADQLDATRSHSPAPPPVDPTRTSDPSATADDPFTHSAGDPPPTPGGLPDIPGYELLGELGRGGMGVVYQARQLALNRLVAVKLLSGGPAASPARQVRFRQEAEAVARLQHPNIVQVFEVGAAGGCSYLALEYVDGGTLQKKVAGVAQPPADTARLVETVARAVHHAHEKRIVHRDLKPANVLLTAGGVPKVADFGLARFLDAEAGVTRTDDFLGTPAYSAPEQVQNRAADIGPGTDVYALGVVLYELLTGRRPFDAGSVPEVLRAVVDTDPVPPRRLHPGCPRDLETITLKCMEKDPAKRYASAADLADDLRRYLADEPIRARPVGSLERAGRWVRRNPAVAALVLVGGLAALASVAAGVGYAYSGRLKTAYEGEAESRRLAEDARQAAEASRQVAEDARGVADEQRGQAVAARGETEAALRTAQTYAYFHRIALADAALRDNGIARAEMLLDECPADRRGWEWGFLKGQCHADLLTIPTGHAEGATDVAVGPDGRMLVSAGIDGAVAAWEADTGRKLWSHPVHRGPCWSVAVSPDGRLVVTGGQDGRVTVRDAADGAERHTLKGPGGGVNAVAFRPDGRQVAASVGGVVQLWDVTTGTAGRTLRGHTGVVQGLSFSPDGRSLASASWDSTVRVWDVDAGAGRLVIPCNQGSLFAVAFSPDGRLLASGGMDTTVKLWAAADGKPVRALTGHTFTVKRLAFRPDGGRLASSSSDGTVRLWDPVGPAAPAVYRGHRGHVFGVAFHTEGHELVSSGIDGTVRRWDATANPEWVAAKGVGTITVAFPAFLPDGRRLVTAGLGHAFEVRDAADGRVLRTLRPTRSHPDAGLFLGVSADGRRVAVGADEQAAEVWDADAGVRVNAIRASAPLTAMALSPDGRRVATGTPGGEVVLWDADTGAEVRRLAGHGERPRCLAFSPDGRRLAATGGGGHARVWEVESGAVVRAVGEVVAEAEPGLAEAAFSPDGGRLAVAAGDAVRVWDVASGRLLRTLRGHQGSIHDVAYSPDGRRLVSGGMDRAVKVWDAETGEELLSLRGPSNQIWGVAVSPDGRRVAACDQNQNLFVWDGEEPTPAVQARRRAASADGLRAWQRREGAAALARGHGFAAEWFFGRVVDAGAALPTDFAGRDAARARLRAAGVFLPLAPPPRER